MPRTARFSPISPGWRGKSEGVEFVEELGRDEVDLAEVGGVRVLADAIEVLDLLASVGIALHAEASEDAYLRGGSLAEAVLRAEGYGDDPGVLGGHGQAAGISIRL